MWEYKEARDMIKNEYWSYSKAEDGERAYRNATLKQQKKPTDVYADMEAENLAVISSRDDRRFMMVDEDAYSPRDMSRRDSRDSAIAAEAMEMHDFGHGADEGTPGESEPLVRRNTPQDKKKKSLFSRNKEEKAKKSGTVDENSKLVDGEEADSLV